MPPSRPTTEHTLLGTTDMMVWAEEFCRIFGGFVVTPVEVRGAQAIDPGTMVSWFANAFELGRSTGRKELCPHDWLQLSDDIYSCRDCGVITADPADFEVTEDLSEEIVAVEVPSEADDPDAVLEEKFREGFDEGRA